MAFDAYHVLISIEPAELQRLVDQLSQTGLATDEDGLCLGSSLIEHWSTKCTSRMEQLGYSGGALACTGKHFADIGAIYVLYDSSRHSLERAHEELERAAVRSRAA